MKKKIILIPIIFLLGVVLISFLYLNYSLNKVKYITREDEQNVEILDEVFEKEEKFNPIIEVKEDKIEWESLSNKDKLSPETSGITNILLCGEENQSGAKRGRTDSMILATINMNTKTIRLISFMRDLYVPIEGHSNNKLNASYAIGGMPLLVSTIEDNFDIHIDGYILVDFEQFEKIIDLLEGVDIEITKEEAKYLNSTNYISKRTERNLVAGTQTLTGSQALGYSRIRYIKTKNGLKDDFGRIWRQKQVLLSIYDKYKTCSYVDMAKLLPQVLDVVTTNMTKDELLQLGVNVLSLKNIELEQTYVPFEGCYTNAYVNEMSVLYIEDIDEIRSKLQKIIQGENMDEILNNSKNTQRKISK